MIESRPAFYNSPLEFAAKLGAENVVVSADKEALRNDLVREAKSRRINDDSIEKVASMSEFHLGTWDEFVDRVDNLPGILKHSLRNSDQKVLAAVNKRKDGKYDCHFNIDRIALFSSRPDHKPEVEKAIFVKKMETAWIHEREHLIQHMTGLIEKSHKKDKGLIIFGELVSSASIITGATILFVSLTTWPVSIPGTILGASSFIGGQALSNTISHYIDHGSEDEKEAYATAREYYNSTPFKITFE